MQNLKAFWDDYRPFLVVLGGIFIIVVTSVVVVLYIPSNTGYHGVITCAPIGYYGPGTTECDELGNVCSSTHEGDPRFYNGRFVYIKHHSEDGVIFFNEDRRETRLSNVSCLIVFDKPR